MIRIIQALNYFRFWLSWVTLDQLITQRIDSIFQLDLQWLKTNGIKLIVLDVDDTITGHLDPIGQETIDWLQNLVQQDFKIGLITNCKQSRAVELKAQLANLPITIKAPAYKPATADYISVMKETQTNPDAVLMIGDKVGTDIYGAYLAGIKYRFLVRPWSETAGGHERGMWGRAQRKFEQALAQRKPRRNRRKNLTSK